MALLEASRKRRRIAALLDVVADDPRLLHVEHHEVAPAGILHDLARRRLGLLVVVLAVDHRREGVAGVALDPLPHVEHRAAGRVHHDAADAAQPLEVADRDAERRHDHHVVRKHGGEVELAVRAMMQELDAHLLELPVHVRIVDDLAHQEEPAVGELVAGLVGVVHRAVHAVAEAELAGQPEGERAHVERVVAGPEQVHEPAVVVRAPLLLDRALEAETLAEVGAVHRPKLHPNRAPQAAPAGAR